MTTPFNPLDKANLAESIERALVFEKPRSLQSIERFCGAGVYSLYYTGDFPAYKHLSKCNKVFLDAPIYVGKADSRGRRKGGFLSEDASGVTLWKRLGDHASSIKQASNLDINDFQCRFLVVDDLWVGLGESLLISKYSPVWNTLVDGFGNHVPGKGRGAGRRSRWDTLHPGRPWAAALADNPMNAEQIGMEVASYIEARYDVGSL